MKHEQYDANAVYPHDDVIRQAAQDSGASYDLLRKVGWVESRYNTDAKSPTGPVGMYQFTKATGRAMGLNISDDGTVDDRKDAAKSAMAAGRLLKQLTDKFHGDELKAALAYNQGEGSSSIKAYDAGNLSGVASEGLGYMKNLMDVAKSPNKELVQGFAGITPTAKPFAVEDYTTDPTAKPVTQSDLPAQAELGLHAEAAPEVKQFSQLQREYNEANPGVNPKAPESTFTGTGDAIKSGIENSVGGMAFRAMTGEYSGSVLDLFKPVASGEFEPGQEDFDRWTKMGLRPEFWNVAAGGDSEHVGEREQMALKNQQMTDDANKAGTAAKVIGSVAGAVGDPTSYIPIAGELKGLSLVSKIAKVGGESALLNVASEGWRTHVAGGHADYTEAALGGLILGGALGGLHHAVSGGAEDAFSGITNRVESRETSMNTGMEDVTKHPQPQPHSEHEGVPFGDASHDPEDTMLGDGSVIAGGSIVDPKAIKAARDLDVYEDSAKAAKGVRMGGLTEISQVTMRSENEEMRKIASNWFRPATGTMENGGYGVARMTVDDITKLHEGRDNPVYAEMYKTFQKILKEDPEWTHGANKSLTRDEAVDLISQRVSMAIEAEDSSLHGALSANEKALHDIVKANYGRKADMLEDTTIYGRHDAPAVADDLSHYRDRYTPRVYSREKKMLAIQRFGSREQLQQAIADSWKVDYRKNPQALDKMLSEGLAEGEKLTPEMVDKFLHDKAYGISHSEVFDSSAMLEEELRGGSGLENNNFLEMRVPLRTDGVIFDHAGQPFAINDLREWNIATIMPKYNRRMNGTAAIHGATGMTELENKERILQLRKVAEDTGNRNLHSEVDAMLEATKVVTGRARRDPMGVAESMMKGMTNMAFFAKNAYMGAQNLTEISALVNRGGLRTMLSAIPMFKHMAFSHGLKPEEMKTVHALLWGKELDDSIRPSMRMTMKQVRDASTAPAWASNAAGAFKWATGELSAKSPWTKVLKETTNTLIDVARQNVLADIAGHIHAGAKSRYLTPTLMKAMSITEDQMGAIEGWMKKYSTMDEHGKISWKTDELRAEGRNDPASFHLWRIGDYVASETLMRPDRLSLQNAKQYGALAQMFLQFKTFTMKSLNGKFLRSYYQATKNGRGVDQVLNLMTSVGLSGMYYVAQAHAKAYGLPEEQRKQYLANALKMNNIGFNSISRSSIAGAPLSAYNVLAAPAGLDIGGTYGRSSILAQEAQTKRQNRPILRATSSEQAQDFVNGVLQQVPAFNIGANAYALGHNALGALSARTPADDLRYSGALLNSAREFIPNDAGSQQLLYHIIKAHGMYTKPKF